MPDTTTLDDLAGRYWDTVLAASPTSALIIGDHRFDDRMEDHSREAEDELIGALEAIVAAAEAIDPASLNRDDRLTRGVLIFEAGTQAAELRSREAEYGVDAQRGHHLDLISYAPHFPLTEPAHARALVDKYRKVGIAFDQAAARLREGVAAERTPPRVACEKVIAQIDAYLAGPLESDPLLGVTAPPGLEDEAAWRAALAAAVTEVVRPGYARYRDTIATDVLPASRPPEKSGLCWLPGGEEAYRAAVHRYTSTDRIAPAIHETGLEVIAELGDEYRRLGPAAVGTDDLAEIYTRLRDDPELRFPDGPSVQAQAERALARAKEAIGEWFGRLPVADCVVAPIPEVAAPASPIAYYLPPATDGSRPGTYFVNLFEPTTRTTFESEALAFHESIPGHHLQLAIAQELEGIPEFRKHALVTAYVEGWGLYTERLSDEMGLYSGEVERMGILSFDSWRACRLVVDTGMHARGWSRQQAIDYMVANSPQAPNNIENEVDRYIGWPGQALAYKIGQLEITRLRGEAEARLGSGFDIKGFHDAVLETGPVPLGLLAEVVEEWVASAG